MFESPQQGSNRSLHVDTNSKSGSCNCIDQIRIFQSDARREDATTAETQPLAQPKEEPEDLAEVEVLMKVVQLNEY